MKPKSFITLVIFLISFSFLAGCVDEMPGCFNGKIPPYPNSKIVKSMCLEDGCYAELETSDTGKKVARYYKDYMSGAGWSIKVERVSTSKVNDDPREETFLALFKENTGLMIDTSTTRDSGKTHIALFMGDSDE